MSSDKAAFIKNICFGFLLFLSLICICFNCSNTVFAEQYQHGIITTIDIDGVRGSYSWIQERKSGGSRLNEHHMMTTTPQIRAAAYGQYYYIMEGGGLNRITLFDIQQLDDPIRQYSAPSSDATSGTFLWNLVFAHADKAYLLQYESNRVWIVDPLAENDSDFKIGELDLSLYDDGDGVCEICNGIVVNSKLFILMQRLNAEGAPETAYLAVFDTETDVPIDTGKDDGSLFGIPLTVKNPLYIQYMEETGYIYVQGSGAISPQPDYTGGIERINPDSYENGMVLDDGDADSHPYGYITGMVLISSTDGFFTGASGQTDNTLYHLNPTDGAVNEVRFSAGSADYMQHKHLAALSGGLAVDKHDRLWIGNISDRRVEIINTTPNQGFYSSDGSYSIPSDPDGYTLQPSQIVFCQEPEVTDDDAAQKPSSSGESGNFCFIGAITRLD